MLFGEFGLRDFVERVVGDELADFLAVMIVEFADELDRLGLVLDRVRRRRLVF